jgi:hypothetical protein
MYLPNGYEIIEITFSINQVKKMNLKKGKIITICNKEESYTIFVIDYNLLKIINKITFKEE